MQKLCFLIKLDLSINRKSKAMFTAGSHTAEFCCIQKLFSNKKKSLMEFLCKWLVAHQKTVEI